MKCTDRNRKKNKRKRRNRQTAVLSVVFMVLCVVAGVLCYQKIKEAPPEALVSEYGKKQYMKPLYRADVLYADKLCVAAGDVLPEGLPDIGGIHAAALFDLNAAAVDFSKSIHERLYPASTTKILTALVAIKHGNLQEMVTVSENAAASSFAPDEQVCGLEAGDVMTLQDLLYGLILSSGNDNATAIAEHIAGSAEAFAEMMNEQAWELMATNSHFVNPSGLHNEEHYTTAYDLYLIFNECIKHQEFLDMISAASYVAHITKADGNASEMEFVPTNHYASGEAAAPSKAQVIGGKTGTTDEAGNCLILLDVDGNSNQYISVVMGAQTKEILYNDMTAMIETIPEG